MTRETQHPWIPQYEIATEPMSDEFLEIWQKAGAHIQQSAAPAKFFWWKADPYPPILEHLSFRFGNQVFFVRVEDSSDRITGPGTRKGVLGIADECHGYPCLMRMKPIRGSWVPTESGWGLVDLRNGESVDPRSLQTDAKIEMTDWELHDFAVQVIRNELTEQGHEIMSYNGNPHVNPSVWFVGEHGPEWVVVRAGRYPQTSLAKPHDWIEIAANCAKQSTIGHFATVIAANPDDAFDDTGRVPALPLWRGGGMQINVTWDPEDESA